MDVTSSNQMLELGLYLDVNPFCNPLRYNLIDLLVYFPSQIAKMLIAAQPDEQDLEEAWSDRAWHG